MVIHMLASMVRQVGKALGFEVEENSTSECRNQNAKVTRTKIESLSKVANDQLLLEAINHNDLSKLTIWIERVKKLIDEQIISSKTGINIPINVSENDKSNNCARSKESFPLILAAASKYDDLALLEKLLSEGADPYLKDSHKVSALMAAASAGAKQKFIRLLSVSSRDLQERHSTLVLQIVLGDKPEILQIFTDHIKDLPSDFYENLLKLSVDHRAQKIYKYILEKHFVNPRSDFAKEMIRAMH